MTVPGLRRRAACTQVEKNVRLGLGLFLLLLIYDGALRKWVLPSAEQILFIAKDALLLGLLGYAMLNRPREPNASMQPAARALFLLYAAWVILETGNLNLPSVLVGIWGLKSHLLYASVILLLPIAFNNLSDLLRWVVKTYPWIVVPVCILAFVQLALPADSFINLQVRGGMEKIAYFGESGLVRVTGTFSYVAGMAVFVQTMAVLGVGLFVSGVRSKAFLIGLGFVLAALPATGSRSVIAVVGVSLSIFLFTALKARLMSTRMAMRIVASIVVLFSISFLTQDAAWVALQQRAESAATSHGDTVRAFTAFTNAFSFFEISGFFGFGSGSANLGALALVPGAAPFSWLPSGIYFEEESGRLVLELGMFGWLFSLAMRVSLFVWAAKLALKGKTRPVRLAGLLALPTMALGMYVGNGVFAPPVGPTYYWFCVGLLAMAQYEHTQAVKQ